VSLAIGVRYLAAVLLTFGSIAVGRGGFITGDDGVYADLSWRLVQLWRGEPTHFSYGAESYLLGTYVYLESAVFALVGPNALVVEFLNGALGGALVALVYNLNLRLFKDRRAALTASVLVAIYPSLVLWSALNLKDSLALILIATVLWLLAVFAERRTAWLIPAIYVPLIFMQDLREYIFIGLALVIPAGVILVPRAARRWSGIGAAASIALSIAMLIAFAAESPTLSASTLATLEVVRNAMGDGARTRIDSVPVVQVQEGQTYIVPPASSTPGAAPTTAPSQRIVTVRPGTLIAVAGAGQATPSDPNVVVVAPGDVVVVGGPAVTAEPTDNRQQLAVGPNTGAVELGSTKSDALAVRTLRYLPMGLMFALFAPLPWSLSRPLDILPMPEMIVWYLCAIAALIVLVRERRDWRRLTPLFLFIGGTLAVLAVAEGNVGTLYRHRAMVIPFVIVLAAPAFVRLVEKISAFRIVLRHRRERRVSLGAVGR
jgi:hypothetical protein